MVSTTNFPLFKNIKKVHENRDVQQKISEKIKYQEYQIEVNNTVTTVLIPLRETKNFEDEMNNLTVDITQDMIRELMRKYRGLVNF